MHPSDSILALIENERVLALEQATIRIASTTFQEGQLADFLARYMSELGLEVRMMAVTHPSDPAKVTRQAIGRLKGSGGGPTLMLNGHMDPAAAMSGWTVDPLGAKFENGWIWGAGAHDDKGGIVAALSAIEAIVRAGVRLRGDILMCPVAAHKAGGIGTRALLKEGMGADLCINMEHSANTIASVLVGMLWVKITTRSSGLFFRYAPEAKARYFNAIEQQAAIIGRLGPSIQPANAEGWLSYRPHPELPGFPMIRYDLIHKDHYGRECDMRMQVRTVPGQTTESVRADLTRALEALKQELPNLDYSIAVPAGGPDDPSLNEPSEVARDHPLTEALAEGCRRATGREPEVGGALRVGNVGDGNILAAAGIPTLQFGPGDIRQYPEWPAPDERVELRELVEAARAIAHAAWQLCH